MKTLADPAGSSLDLLDPTTSWRQHCAEAGLPAAWQELFSPAELVIAREVKWGLSNKEIAALLSKSPATVKGQVASILHKVNLPSRGRLIAWLHTGKTYEGVVR